MWNFQADCIRRRCPGKVGGCAAALTKLLGDRRRVHLATRRHLDGRDLDDAGRPGRDPAVPFGPLGVLVDWGRFRGGLLDSQAGVPKILRYGVRSDLVEYVEGAYNASLYAAGAPLRRPFVDLAARDRPVDVTHLWNAAEVGRNAKHGRHRDGVARALRSMWGATEEQGGRKRLRMRLDTAGSRATLGRNQVQPDYVRALLDSKIVVVSQRDGWEDHYRLMEGLALGGLVFTDPMQPLPRYLEDGVSVVVYRSLAELRDKILRYLAEDEERVAIARRGHRIALDHHRSWHVMERVIFGNWSDPLLR